MFRRSWSLVAIAAVLGSLTLAALAPLAAADHAYSHRYIVYGRVVDAEGNPVPGLTVDLGYEKPFTPEGPCANQPGTDTDAFGATRNQPVTNQFGEFIFCFHTHGLSRGTPGTGILRIASHNVEKRFEFDGFMRYSFQTIQLETAVPAANRTALEERYTILGRVWAATEREIKVEGVGVYGDTLHNKPYELTVAFEGEEPVTLTGETNSYGDFSVRVPVEGRPTGGTVTLKLENHTFPPAPVDPQIGATHIRGQIGDLKTTPGAPLFALVALIAVVALAARRE